MISKWLILLFFVRVAFPMGLTMNFKAAKVAFGEGYYIFTKEDGMEVRTPVMWTVVEEK
jgi:hypothetical protein